MGIRAEAISIVAPGQGTTTGTVKFVERLGDRTLVHVTLSEGTTVVAEDAGMSRVKVGDPVGLAFGSAAHLFDSQRGYHAEQQVET